MRCSEIYLSTVRVEITEDIPDIASNETEERIIQVSSQRIDAVISRVYNLSRQEAVNMFPAGLIFLNGRSCTENARQLKEGDVISVRGKGKFEYAGERGLSKKGKLNCRVRIYI